MIYEIRDYHYSPEKFEAYKTWGDEAVPVLRELFDLVGFYVVNGDDAEVAGTAPEKPSIGYANITWIIRWESREQRDAEFTKRMQSPKWAAVWAKHPDPNGYVQLLSRFAEAGVVHHSPITPCAQSQTDLAVVEQRAQQLRDLIDRYQLSVSEAFTAFLDSGLCGAPANRVEWGANGILHTGNIASGGVYRKLAYGLHIERNGLVVAFDFGTNGEVNEFDAFRLTQFWDDNRLKARLFQSERELEDTFAEASAVGAFQQTQSKRFTLKTS